MDRRLDIALDVAESALKRLAKDLAAEANLLNGVYDLARAFKLAEVAARTLSASRTEAAGALDRLGDALDPGPEAKHARAQAALVRDVGVTAAEARAMAKAWAAYGDARAVAS